MFLVYLQNKWDRSNSKSNWKPFSFRNDWYPSLKEWPLVIAEAPVIRGVLHRKKMEQGTCCRHCSKFISFVSLYYTYFNFENLQWCFPVLEGHHVYVFIIKLCCSSIAWVTVQNKTSSYIKSWCNASCYPWSQRSQLYHDWLLVITRTSEQHTCGAFVLRWQF